MYYLQTRYYDPELGRFISQDSLDYADPETINGLNLYAYCGNNPVMNVDPTGEFAISSLLITMLIGAVIGGALSFYEANKNGLTGWNLFAATIGGAIFGAAISGAGLLGAAAATTGLVITSTLTLTGSTLFGFAVIGTGLAAAVQYGLNCFAYSQEFKIENAFMRFTIGAFEGLINFGFGGVAAYLGFYKYSGIEKHNYISNLIHKPFELAIRSLIFNVPSALIRGLLRKQKL